MVDTLQATRWEDRTAWPLSPTQEAVFTAELGERAWSHAQDCNPFELNDEDDVLAYVLVSAGVQR